MITEHPIRIERTLRYFMAGDPDRAEKLLIALHGYGQHPHYFLRKMESLVEQGWCVLAPEGLHRFYTQGMSGRVGASWMTREDREADIHDNMEYLDRLLQAHAHIKHRVLLGFSQGTATAIRFFCSDKKPDFQQLIMWAGSFPPDLDLPSNVLRLNEVGIDLTVGCEDAFIKSDDVKELQALFDERGVRYTFTSFQGGHDLDAATLERLLQRKV